MRKTQHFGSLILVLILICSLILPQCPMAWAAGKIYYPIDMTEAVLASRVAQRVSGGCAVASMATIESFMYGAVTDADKETVYNELITANGDDNYAYWGNVGYKTSQDSIDWENVYAQLAQGYPCIIHRPANGSQSQHWSVVAGYAGSSYALEPDRFLVVEVNEKSGAAIQTVLEWRGSVSVDRYSWRGDGLAISSLSGIHFAVNHPPVIKETGVAHVVSGHITSDSNLTELQIRVVSLDTETVIFSRDLIPNVKTYAFSGLDSAMSYSSWPEGTYYLTIYAKDAAGAEDMHFRYFEIASSYPETEPDPLYTVSFDSGNSITVPMGESFLLPDSDNGWNLRRSDGKWFTAEKTWLTDSELSAGGSSKYLFDAGTACVPDGWWIRDTVTFPAFTFVDPNSTGTETSPTNRTVCRIFGENRHETALTVADALKTALGVSHFDAVLIASGTESADALSGSYLATVKNAPILLTNGANANDLVRYITDNLSESGTVYILGGTSAVSQEIEDAVKTTERTVKRLAGETRIQTNLAILQEAGVNGKEILVTTCWDYADSLAVSATGLPILLVNPNSNELADDQLIFLQAVNAPKLTIIGGSAIISSEFETELEAYFSVDRIFGSTREETSAAVAEHYFSQPDTVCIAYSRNFPDALSGGPLAHAMGAPLLLVNSGTGKTAQSYISANDIASGYVLGGAAVLSDGLIRSVFSLPSDSAIQIY